MIIVVEKYDWYFGKTNCGDGGQVGQVTRCQFNDIEFWVRENINGIHSFYVSSGERLGDKIGRSKTRNSRQVLELLCPFYCWDLIARHVHEADPLHRPVTRNRLFNKNFLKGIIAPK